MTHSPLIILGGVIIRIIQVVVESSLYVVIGLLTAGATRAMVKPESLRRVFGFGRWSGPIRAWVAATTLLPVCSLGVLPVIRELRRARVSRAAILTFALATPMLNPISLVYGMSYLGPKVLLVLIGGAFVVSVGVGLALGHLVPEEDFDEATPDEVGSVPAKGLLRVMAAGVHAAREATGPSAGNILIGILGAGVVTSLFTAPYLATSMTTGDPLAIPRMMLVAPLAYVGPDQGIAMVPEMLKFRQSAGAMFVLVALGVGMSLGHVRWIWRSYGRRIVLTWMGLLLGTTLAVAYAVDGWIPAVGTANDDNDHFAILGNSAEGYRGIDALTQGLPAYLEKVSTFHWMTTGFLAALVLAGLALRAIGERGRFEAFLTTEEPAVEEVETLVGTPIWNRPLPPRFASSVGVFCVAGIVMAGSYAYFPSPAEAFRDMQIIKADFYGELSATSLSAPLHHLDLWDRQAGKLSTGAIIRLSTPGAEARRLTSELRQGIQELRIVTQESRRDEARVLFAKLQTVYDRCKVAYGIH